MRSEHWLFGIVASPSSEGYHGCQQQNEETVLHAALLDLIRRVIDGLPEFRKVLVGPDDDCEHDGVEL